jgi:hypothetical protein
MNFSLLHNVGSSSYVHSMPYLYSFCASRFPT